VAQAPETEPESDGGSVYTRQWIPGQISSLSASETLRLRAAGSPQLDHVTLSQSRNKRQYGKKATRSSQRDVEPRPRPQTRQSSGRGRQTLPESRGDEDDGDPEEEDIEGNQHGDDDMSLELGGEMGGDEEENGQHGDEDEVIEVQPQERESGHEVTAHKLQSKVRDF